MNYKGKKEEQSEIIKVIESRNSTIYNMDQHGAKYDYLEKAISSDSRDNDVF